MSKHLMALCVAISTVLGSWDEARAQARKPRTRTTAGVSNEIEPVLKEYLGWKPLAVGDVGKLGRLRVVQIVDGENAIVEIKYNTVGDPDLRSETVWMNIPTEGMADDRTYSTGSRYFEVTGTKRYATALGASKTVMVLKPTTDPAEEKANADKEKRAAKRRAEEAKAQAGKEKRHREADRTWTYAASGETMRAAFLTRIADKVKLRKEDGTGVVVAIEDLSEEDQEWIRNRSK